MKISFALRTEKNKRGESSLELIYTHLGLRTRISCGISIKREDFKNNEVTSKDPLSIIKNQRINDIRKEYNDVILSLAYEKKEPTTQLVHNMMEAILFPQRKKVSKDTINITDMLHDFKLFIKYSENGTRKKKNNSVFSLHTIKGYKTTNNHLQNFCDYKKRIISYTELGEDFYIDFVDFIRYQPEEYRRYKKQIVNNDNSIDKEIKNLKTFLNYGLKKKWHDKYEVINEMIRLGYDPKPFALPEENLIELINKNKMPTERLQITRDLFLFGVIGCLRISDQISLSFEQNITFTDKGINLVFIPNKTNSTSGETVSIRIPKFGKDIIEKYRGSKLLLPRFSSNDDNHKKEYNIALKELVEYMGWEELKVKTTKKIEGTLIMETLNLKERATSHLQRKTGVTFYANSNKVSEVVARVLGGFSIDSRAFKQYIDINSSKTNKASELTWDAVLRK